MGPERFERLAAGALDGLDNALAAGITDVVKVSSVRPLSALVVLALRGTQPGVVGAEWRLI